MKLTLFILLFLLISCNDTNSDTHLYDYNKDIESCKIEVDELFHENGMLREKYENAKEYIQLLEQENEYLKNQRDSITYSRKN